MHGWELGNELPQIPADVLAADYQHLRKLVDALWPDAAQRPLLIGNDLNSNAAYLRAFLPQVAGVLDVVTYHHYDGYGLDPELASKT